VTHEIESVTHIQVKISLAYVKLVFIHPENDSYPLSTIQLSSQDEKKDAVNLFVQVLPDQLYLHLMVSNLQAFDNT
jgi:hypothetical protein